jgi:hypothetical protein
MPILKPQIQAALRASGLLDGQEELGASESLKRAGLGLDPTLEVVESLMQRGGSEVVRLRAAELSLKANGLLKDQAAPLPSITIIINDPLSKGGINPILIPRELQL